MLLRMLNLSVFILYLFMAFYFVIFEYLWFHFLFWLWIRVGRLSTHTHVHLHNISSIPELHPFRRKCWLCSCEIIIFAMASQTLPEFMVLITSWGNNLRIVIGKCSHSNRILSIWACNGWGSGCLASLLWDVSEERFGHLLTDVKLELCM